MLYDTMLAMVRAHLPELIAVVERAAVFHYDVAPHEVLPKNRPIEYLPKASIGFELPYPITVIEDRGGCVLIGDTTRGQQGTVQGRLFIDCVPAAGNEENYMDPPEVAAFIRKSQGGFDPGAVSISMGTFSSPAQTEGNWLANGVCHRAIVGTVDRLVLKAADVNDLPTMMWQVASESGIRNAMTAVEEILHIQELPHFAGWPEGHNGMPRYSVDPSGLMHAMMLTS